MKAVVRDVMSIHPISVRKATAVKEVAVRLRVDRGERVSRCSTTTGGSSGSSPKPTC